MYTPENYLWGLVAYYLGAGVVIFCCWRFSSWIRWRHLRNLILLLIGVLLLFPFSAYPEMDYLAPAWVVSIFEGLTESTQNGFLRAGIPLLVACIAALILYIGVSIGLYFRTPASPSGVNSEDAPASEENAVLQNEPVEKSDPQQ